MLVCPVRGCHMALAREDRRLLCPRGHSFDVARSGYVNLLQPQERRSKQAGDSKAVVAARRRLHDRGVTGPLLSAIGEMMAASPNDVVLDAGCVDTFAHGFTLVDRRRATTEADLDAAAVQDVLLSIYRPMRSQPAGAMRVTFSLDLLLFRAV